MAGNDKMKMKSVCFKCNINKWIVDYKEGCASMVSRTSVCLFCEQAEKIEKLQKSLKEKNVEIHKMKDQLIKLEAKVEEMNKSSKNSTIGNKEQVSCSGDLGNTGQGEKGASDVHCCKKSLQLEE